jgi:uncharacterized protein (TIGR01777 family)
MRIVISGATGFLGRHLTLRSRREGHQVVALVRDIDGARALLGADVDLVGWNEPEENLVAALDGADAVVNLAGRPVATRWTRKVRRELVDSRVGVTRRLVEALGRAERRPKVLINASAVGFYGQRGDEIVDERSPAGTGFLSRLCLDWEREARAAERFGVRVVLPRIGVVLGAEGGALAAMLPVFRLGLGATLGHGDQHFAWIHIDDLLALFVTAIEDPTYRGCINAVAPVAPTNREFTRILGAAVGRPAPWRIPRWVLRLGLGEATQVLTASHRVEPRRAFENGFRFRFPELREALDDLLDPRGVVIRSVRGQGLPAADYLQKRSPTHCLEQTTWIDAPLDDVFDFFSRAENLGALTPPRLAFEIQTPTPIEMATKTEILYRIRLGPVPMRWRTVIEQWQPGARFVDAQYEGPYACWYHEHLFEAVGGRTRVTDRVHYAVPFGWLGQIVNWAFVSGTLRRIFAFRSRAIAHRFGVPPTAEDADSKVRAA